MTPPTREPEVKKCARCGVADRVVLDLDTGSACHPELHDCIAALLVRDSMAKYTIDRLSDEKHELAQQYAAIMAERDAAVRDAGTRDEWESELNMVRGENATLRDRLAAAESERDAAVESDRESVAMYHRCRERADTLRAERDAAVRERDALLKVNHHQAYCIQRVASSMNAALALDALPKAAENLRTRLAACERERDTAWNDAIESAATSCDNRRKSRDWKAVVENNEAHKCAMAIRAKLRAAVAAETQGET